MKMGERKMNDAFMTTPIGDLPVNSEGMRKLADALAAAIEKQTVLSDKHWEECRQIALYDDELKRAKALLKKLSSAEYAKHYDDETVAELFDYWEGEQE